MAALYVFPDTNFLLHFQRPDQIDWPTLTGASSVVLVLASVVIGELDDIKNRHESRKLKQRARGLATWVKDSWRGRAKSLRPNVTFEVHLRENDEHLTDGLVARVNDDRLIANALAFRTEGKDVAIATNDNITGMKAEERGIRWIEPGEDLALPLEKDEIEKERDELRRQQEAERSRAPKLQVDVVTEGASGIVIQPMPPLPTPSEVRRNRPLMKKRGEANRDGFAGLGNYPAMGVPNSSVDAYNVMIKRFHDDYEQVYRRAADALDFNRRLVELNFQVENVGGASATDLMIRVELPPGLIASDEYEAKEVPKPPEAPKPPGPFGIEAPSDVKLGRVLGVERLYAPLVPDLPIYDPWAPKIEAGGRRATWRDRQLLHGDHTELRPLPCLVAPELIGTAIEVRFAVHCAELARPVEQVLQISVTESTEAI